MIKVELTIDETYQGAHCGIMRQIDSLRKKSIRQREGLKDGWGVHVEGALAELVVFKHYGVPWVATVGTYKAADILGSQVRSTQHNPGHLIARPKDEDWWRPYILVNTPKLGLVYEIAGWMILKDIKVDRFWREDKDSWWVPQGVLNDMKDFNIRDWQDGRNRTDHDRTGRYDDLECQPPHWGSGFW